MNYTSIEQSKKFLELGLNPDSADMYYFLDPTPVGNIYIPSLIFIEKHLKSRMPEYDKGDIPCWSLCALLKVMPRWNDYKPFIGKNECYYINDDKEIYHRETGTSIEAAYSMVIWLLENRYIKTVVSNNT